MGTLSETCSDRFAAQQALKNLTDALFDALRERTAKPDRPVITVVQRAFLDLHNERLEARARGNDPAYHDLLLEVAKTDLFALPVDSLPNLRSVWAQPWRKALQGIVDQGAVRQQQEAVARVLQAHPEIFLESTSFWARLLEHVDAADELDEPLAEASTNGQRIYDAASDSPEPVQAVVGAAAAPDALHKGKLVIRHFTNALFDLIIRRLPDRLHDGAATIREAFVASCNRRLERTIAKGSPPAALLMQLVAINPRRLKTAMLSDLPASAALQWDDILKAQLDLEGFAIDLNKLRKLYLDRPDLFARDSLPASLPRLLALAQGKAEDSELGTVRSSAMGTHTAYFRDGVCIVTLTNSSYLSQGEVQRMSNDLLHVLEQSENPRMALNLAAVENVSSAFLGMLIALNKHAHKLGGEVRLCEIQEAIHHLIELTGVNRLLRMHATLDEAVRKLR